MNKDQVAGAVKKAGGEVRANVAKVTGDKKAEAAGRRDQLAGAAQETYGNAKKAVKDALNDND